MVSANSLAALAADGAGFAPEAKMFLPDELVQIAAAGTGRLVIRENNRLALEDVIRIADARLLRGTVAQRIQSETPSGEL